MARMSPRRAADRARLLARVFQDPLGGTCGDLTIEENLALAEARGRARGLGRAVTAVARGRWRQRLGSLGLGLGSARRPDGPAVGGQRQAVALLMATMAPSKILLLDEHTAALDPRTAEFVLGLTTLLVRELGLTTLMVTHSMHQALALGDRLLMLHEGRIGLDVAGGQDGRGPLGRVQAPPRGRYRRGPLGRVQAPPRGRRVNKMLSNGCISCQYRVIMAGCGA